MQKPQTSIHEAKYANSSSVNQFQTMKTGSQLPAVSTSSLAEHPMVKTFLSFLSFPARPVCFVLFPRLSPAI